MRPLIKALAVGLAAGAAALTAFFVARKSAEQPDEPDAPKPKEKAEADDEAKSKPKAEETSKGEAEAAAKKETSETEAKPADEAKPEEEEDDDEGEVASEEGEAESEEEAVSEEGESEPEEGEVDLSVLDGTIADLREALASGRLDAHLDAVAGAESANKDRKGAHAAIAKRREDLGDG